MPRVVLGRVGFSADSEVRDWNVNHIAYETVGDKIEWLRENHPDLTIMRRTNFDVERYQVIYEWYVDFNSQEDFVHYKLTHGYQETT